jgi:hypothetical protein
LTASFVPSRGSRAADTHARALVARMKRYAWMTLGAVIVVLGVVIAPLPGPGGLPVVVVGLMLILRHSFKARRQFVRFAHAHPRMAYPIRRLLRRDPEFLKIFWTQMLRVERLILPRRLRLASRIRRSLFKRRTAKT